MATALDFLGIGPAGANATTLRPSEAMIPQSAVGGATPAPRKLRPAANTIIAPSEVVPKTITGLMTLGMTSRRRMRTGPARHALAASINSICKMVTVST